MVGYKINKIYKSIQVYCATNRHKTPETSRNLWYPFIKAATWSIRAVSVYGMSAHVCVAASLLAIEGFHLLELFQGFLGLFYCCLLGSGQAHHSDLRA